MTAPDPPPSLEHTPPALSLPGPPADETAGGEDESAAGGKPGWRSRTAVIAVLAAALLTSALVIIREREEPVEEETAPVSAGFDVSRFPRGMLYGEPAPDFSFPLFDGTRFDIIRHFADDGRPLVLNIWASWCGPCRNEIPAVSRVANDNPQVAFAGVAANDRFSDAHRFASEIGASYPMGIEDVRPTAEVFPFIGLPTTYLINAQGTVVRQIQGEVTAAVLQAFIDYDF